MRLSVYDILSQRRTNRFLPSVRKIRLARGRRILPTPAGRLIVDSSRVTGAGVPVENRDARSSSAGQGELRIGAETGLCAKAPGEVRVAAVTEQVSSQGPVLQIGAQFSSSVKEIGSASVGTDGPMAGGSTVRCATGHGNGMT